ncbi:VWA domain-containing protein [Rhodopirellula halodulae]|uniref:VWA domain-containing protein n=1 Tax=Rhodopirellula halodulae TaxID=2894198 RepID=UPI001E3D3466|nr:VWA domain-containing protein [Rhodopirellula sp. JC737]MCC9655463.1 VWA domain-containing protein [Rhodopirellula sp. JC737]
MNPTEQVVYEFARATTLDGWWIWAAVLLVVVAAFSACVYFYRRDVEELRRPVRWTLIGLRLVAVAAIVFLFFDLVRRTERRVTRPSEVIVLVDTSQSMSLPSGDSIEAPSRMERARELVADSNLVETFAEEHRTSVYVFDQATEPRLVQTRFDQEVNASEEASSLETESGEPTSPFLLFGGFCLIVFAIASVVSFALGIFRIGSGRGSNKRASVGAAESSASASAIGWALLVAAITMVCGIVSIGGVYAVHTDRTLTELMGMETQATTDDETNAEGDEEVSGETDEDMPMKAVDWDQIIVAGGAQSRIGDALRSVLVDHDPTTLAGVIVITDGQNNGGATLTSALALARRGEVPVYPVGMGSSQPPTNIRVVDLEVPRRVYPGDKFVVASVLQATGTSEMEVDVELVDALDNEGAADEGSANGSTTLPGGVVLETQRITLQPDATLTDLRFEIEPQTVGRRRLAVRVVVPAEDRNDTDNMQTARYEVVARKLRVLAIAGGPTREYRFVRNLLYRDESVQLDVWLQTGMQGMSQDADELLSAFPATAEDLFEYDAVVMFDPDWSAIDASSLDLLDRFLTEQAGGLVLVAGPVFHPKISGDRSDGRSNQIGAFFPVNLATRGPLLGGGRQGGSDSWPLEFTPEASQAEFLWVADSPEESFGTWQEYGGVYDYVGVKSAKPGAKVYAYFSDPTTEVSGSLPIFLASQFYGAGRVFFQGSGEVWRLRAAGDRYFDSYYTKLIRWVSEGRLLRDSNRGVLLVDSDRAMVGQNITLRAVLVDDQFQPLTEPSVTAKLLAPDGKIKDLKLTPAADSPRGGTYTGNFVATKSGSYEIQLAVGDALDEQLLRQSVQVRLPTSELERPRRADDELENLAAATRGEYVRVDDSVAMQTVQSKLNEAIVPQSQVTLLAGTPDAAFTLRRNAILMWLIASVLTFEWITRRLHRLA